MTALELAAALLTPDSDLLPKPSTHELHDVLPTPDGFVCGCACGWWSLPFASYADVASDFRLHKTIHGYVHSERAGWVHA